MVWRRRWAREIALSLARSLPGLILLQFRRFWQLVSDWSNVDFLFGKIASAKTGTSPPPTPPITTWWEWLFTSQGNTTLMVIGFLWIGGCVLWGLRRLVPPRLAPRQTRSANSAPPAMPKGLAVTHGGPAPLNPLRLGTENFPTTDSLLEELKALHASGCESSVMNRSAPPTSNAMLRKDETVVHRFEEHAVNVLGKIARPDEVAGFSEIGTAKPDFSNMRIAERYVYWRTVMKAKLERLQAITDRLEEASRNLHARGNPHDVLGKVLSDGRGGTTRWTRADLNGLRVDDREELFNIHPALRSWWLAGQ